MRRSKKVASQKGGKSVFEIIKDPIGHFNEAFREIPSKLNNISTETLQKYGNEPIRSLTVIRAPLKEHWSQILNYISLGKFNELKKKYGYDKLFHLSLVAHVSEPIIIEKNEVIHIAPLKTKQFDKGTEHYNIHLSHQMTLNEMIDKTRNLMGNDKFYDYDAFRGNNCQDFIRSILLANNLLSNEANKFIYQDISKITQELEKSKKSSFVPETIKKITRLGSALSRMIGKGHDSIMTENMVDFINKGGFEFL